MTRRRFWTIIAGVLLAGLALCTIVLWVALPSLVRWQLVRQVEAMTGRRLTLAALELDLGAGRLSIRGVRLADRVPGPALAELDRLDMRFRPRALLRGHLWIDELTLSAPRVRIVRIGRGTLNISDLLARPRARSGAGPFTLEHFALADGTMVFEDHTLAPARTWRAEALTVEAAALSTVSSQPSGRARLTATVAGAPLSVEASGIRLLPLEGRARVTLRDVDATLANLYLPPGTAVVLEKAVVGAGFDVTVDARGGVGLDGQARIDDLVIRRRAADTALVSVPSLVFALTSAPGPDGRLLDRVEVTGRASVFDPRPGRSDRFEVERLRLVAEGLDAAGRAPARVGFTATLPGGGALDVQGTVSPVPAGAALRARIGRVDLAFWAPYLSLPVELAGVAEADLAVDAGSGGVRLRGGATINRAVVSDGTRRLAAADQLELTGLDARWPKARVERVRLHRPRARLGRDHEGRLAISELVEAMKRPGPGRAEGTASGAGAKPPGLPPDFAIEVGEVSVEDGRLRLDDASVEPPARLRVAPIRLTVRDLAWPARRPAAVQLRAATPGAGTLEAKGTVTLDPLRFEMRARMAGIALEPYRPYVPLAARLEGRVDGDLTMKGALGPKTEIGARGAVALSDLAFRDGDRPILTVGRLELAGLDYAWPATASIERVRMQKSWVLVERGPDGSLPLTSIFRPAPRAPRPPAAREPAPGAAPAVPPAASVTVRESVFEGGAATIVDAAVSPAARIEVAGVRLVAHDFVWPARAPVPVELEAPTPGSGTLTARGALDLASRTVEMHVTASGVALAPAQPYLRLRGRVSGKASGDLQVRASFEPVAVTARGTASVADLAVAEGDRPLLTVQRLETTGLDYAWPATVTIGEVRLQKPWAEIERAADGAFPLRALLAPPAEIAPRNDGAPGGPAPGGGVDVRVRRVAAEDGSLAIVDSAATPPAHAEIRGARLVLRNLAWPAGPPTEVRLRAVTGTGGAMQARGQLRLDTKALDLQVTLKQMDVATARAFLPSRGTLAGKLDADLRVKGTLAPLAVEARGQVAVDDTIFGDGQRMLAYIKRVDVTGFDADWPSRVTLARVSIAEPWLLLERDADGSLPLLTLLAPGPAAVPRSSSAPAPARPAEPRRPGPVVTVGAVAVDEGFVRFVDRTTTPAFTEEASRIKVDGRALGTAQGARGRLTLAGRLTGGAPFELEGAVGALEGPLSFDLEGKLTDFPLPRVNPYLNKLIGWIAHRGLFSTTVRYRAADDKLDATHEIVLGQPEFAPSRRGDAVRERVGVPFGLLISLLKNSRGEVDLTVPVSGDIASRRFDFSDAFWEAVRKTAIGVIALPVSWVGKIFYSEDARVETIRIWPVYFEPGTERFTKGFDRHAARLAAFLRDAPGVTLAMKPVLTVDDITALKRDAVRRRIDAAARAEGVPSGTVAARLFAERSPGRRAPAEVEEIVGELAKFEPSPDAAIQALVARRMETTRSRLQQDGRVGPDRLRLTDGRVPVEGSGLGRIEFEIAP